jgi:T5SS/PEP-CTERM-associated repeat protein
LRDARGCPFQPKADIMGTSSSAFLPFSLPMKSHCALSACFSLCLAIPAIASITIDGVDLGLDYKTTSGVGSFNLLKVDGNSNFHQTGGVSSLSNAAIPEGAMLFDNHATLTQINDMVIGGPGTKGGSLTAIDSSISIYGYIPVGFNSGGSISLLRSDFNGWTAGITLGPTATNGIGKLAIYNDSSKMQNFTATFVQVGWAGQGGMLQYGPVTSVVGSLDIGHLQNATGLAQFVGPLSTLTVTKAIDVGKEGTGTLELHDGAKVTVYGSTAAGLTSTGNGTILVKGENSFLQMGSMLSIGREGNGALTVEGGSAVEVGVFNKEVFEVGVRNGGQGTVSVSGSHSSIEAFGVTTIGYESKGSLSVTDKAKFISHGWTGVAFNAPSAEGTILVDDAFASFQSLNLAHGEHSGTATLEIRNGGTVEIGEWFDVGTNSQARVTSGGTLHTGRNLASGGTAAELSVSGVGSKAIADDSIVIGWQGHGTVSARDGGQLVAKHIQVLSDGVLDVTSSDSRASLVTAPTLSNQGLVTLHSSDAGATGGVVIQGALTNEKTVSVALGNNGRVVFDGDFVNEGNTKITQISGTTGGLTQFTGTLTNNGDFVQDPTTVQIQSLINNGTYTAGLGDRIEIMDTAWNTGTMNFSGSHLSTVNGLINDGIIAIFDHALLATDISGIGSVVLHISNFTQSLFIQGSFSGNLNIVFDQNYHATGFENFVHFGRGASIERLTIGGVNYGQFNALRGGYLQGNGNYQPKAVPDQTTTVSLLLASLTLALSLRRKWAVR